MKSTGMVRIVDAAGRIYIPKELCHKRHIGEGYAFEIHTEGNNIILVPRQRNNQLTCLLDNALTLVESKSFKDAEYPTEPNRAERIKELVEAAFNEAIRY